MADDKDPFEGIKFDTPKADPFEGLKFPSDTGKSQPQSEKPEDVYKVTSTDIETPTHREPKIPYQSSAEDVLLAAPTAFVEGAKTAKKVVKEDVPLLLATQGAPLSISVPQHLQFLEDIGSSALGLSNVIPAVAAITTGFKAVEKGIEALPEDTKIPLPFDDGDHITAKELLDRVNNSTTKILTASFPDAMKNSPLLQHLGKIGDMALPIVVTGLAAKGEVKLAHDLHEGADMSGKNANKVVEFANNMTPKDVQDYAQQTVVNNLSPDIAHLKEKQMNIKKDMQRLNQTMGQDAANMLVPKVQEAQKQFEQQANNLISKSKLEQAKAVTETDEGKAAIDEHLKSVNEEIDKLKPKENAVQKPSAEVVDAHTPSATGEKVGEGDTKKEAPQARQEEKVVKIGSDEEKNLVRGEVTPFKEGEEERLRTEMKDNGWDNVAPIIVEEGTNKILDGNKRDKVSAYLELPDKKIQYVPKGTTVEEAQKITADNEKKLAGKPEAALKEGDKTSESDGKKEQAQKTEGQKKDDVLKQKYASDNDEAKKYGSFDSAPHLVNSYNKAKGTDFKTFDELKAAIGEKGLADYGKERDARKIEEAKTLKHGDSVEVTHPKTGKKVTMQWVEKGVLKKGAWEMRVSDRETSATSPELQEMAQKKFGESKPVKQSVLVSPFYDASITNLSDASKIRESAPYKKQQKMIQSVAKAMGIRIDSVDETIGGFKNSEGTKIKEVSNRVNIKAKNIDEAEQFAAVLGALSHETQEATIAAHYIEHGSPNQTAIEVEMKVKDLDAAIKALEESGIDDYTINESDKTVHVLDFSNGNDLDFDKRMSTFAESSKDNIYGEQTEYHAVESRYIDAEARTKLLDDLKSKAEQSQGGAGVRDLYEQAQAANKKFIESKAEKAAVPEEKPAQEKVEPKQEPPVKTKTELSKERFDVARKNLRKKLSGELASGINALPEFIEYVRSAIAHGINKAEDFVRAFREDVPQSKYTDDELKDAFTKTQNESDATSTKNAIVNAERLEQGLPPIGKINSIDLEAVREKVKQHLDNPDTYTSTDKNVNPHVLAQWSADHPSEPISAWQEALLGGERDKLRQARQLAWDNAEKAEKENDADALLKAQAIVADKQALITTNDKASSYRGTQWSDIGRQRQQMIADDYSADGLLKKYDIVNHFEPVPKEVQAELRKQAKRIADLEEKLKNKKQDAQVREQAVRDTAIKDAAHKLADAIRRGKTSRPSVFMSASPASLVWDGALEVVAKSIELTGDVAQAVKNGLEHIKNSDWYKNATRQTQNEAETMFKDWYSDKTTAERRRESYLVTRLNKLKEQNETGDYTPKPKKPPLSSPVIDDLQRQIADERKKADAVIDKRKRQDMPFYKRMFDFASDYQHLGVITSPAAIGKIGMNVPMRLALHTIYDAARGTVLNLPKVRTADRFSTEFSANMKSIAQRWKTITSSSVWKDSLNSLVGSTSKVDILKGIDREDLNPKWNKGLNILLRTLYSTGVGIHKFLKDPVFKAEYDASQAYWNEILMNDKADITDPNVVDAAKSLSLSNGLAAQFMQDNSFAKRWYAAVGDGIQKKGEYHFGVEAGKFAAKIINPVVKFPANYGREIINLTTGLVQGMAKTVQQVLPEAISGKGKGGGWDKLSPIEKNKLVGKVLVGGAGAIAMTYGWNNYQHFGGYYTSSKDLKNKLPLGSIKIGDETYGETIVGKVFLHFPLLAVMQMAATARRVYEDRKKSGDKDALTKGLGMGVASTFQELPTMENITKTGTKIEYGQVGKVIQGEGASFIPNVIRYFIPDNKKEPKPVDKSLMEESEPAEPVEAEPVEGGAEENNSITNRVKSRIK